MTAKKLVCNEFDCSYRFRDDVVIATGPEDTTEAPSAKNMFDNLPAFCMLQYGTADELSRYLSAMPEDVRNEDVLQWWYEHKHVYPNLHRMALDYHTVPCKYCFLSVQTHYSCLCYYIHEQVPPSTLNESSVKVISSYLTSAVMMLAGINACRLPSASATGADGVL